MYEDHSVENISFFHLLGLTIQQGYFLCHETQLSSSKHADVYKEVTENSYLYVINDIVGGSGCLKFYNDIKSKLAKI